MTVVRCKHCGRTCAGPAGLAAHIRSMHPETLPETLQRQEVPQPEIEFCDPPPRRRGARSLQAERIIAALRERPGSWARVSTGARAGAYRLADLLRKRGLAVTARRIGETTWGVWARWEDR